MLLEGLRVVGVQDAKYPARYLGMLQGMVHVIGH
jgi:hypothetical protein